MKKLQLLFNSKYATAHRIGLSRHSEVYLAFEVPTERQLAIKIQPEDLPNRLERQAKIYRIICGGVGIPHLYWYGVEHGYRALVTENLGPSLEQLLKYCGGTFTLKTVLMIFQQIIDRLKWLHENGFVYNDMDSENFLVGLGQKADKIFMVDFGSCKKFLDWENNHLELKDEQRPLHNNSRFLSIHGSIGKRQSRRDDLQSLGYMLIYFNKGSLPWDNLMEQESGTLGIIIKEKKMGIPTQLLCEGLPQQFVEYFNYVKALEFQEEPDYSWIKRLFKDLFQGLGHTHNLIFDWAQKHKY